ncbi:MAG: hypothetical protein JWP28_1341 [Phenylobacterium sp.]|uniref:hypothetical protein n=1 Tax=Phenylobacterium sp. TaxID=1871053 RepID=UPI002609DB64|nr:hypothetical protein [Phenylobacterium sp.]MDB5497310.1 hypothetical protein [Phenylobacterium sp.]
MRDPKSLHAKILERLKHLAATRPDLGLDPNEGKLSSLTFMMNGDYRLNADGEVECLSGAKSIADELCFYAEKAPYAFLSREEPAKTETPALPKPLNSEERAKGRLEESNKKLAEDLLKETEVKKMAERAAITMLLKGDSDDR